MAFIDYYKILGVDKDIPQKDIRGAYRKRAKQFHPDLHPNDAKAKAKFQALNEAYDVLSDPEKRKKYEDRKSTRLNSSHANISYAVFCLKKNNYIFKLRREHY